MWGQVRPEVGGDAAGTCAHMRGMRCTQAAPRRTTFQVGIRGGQVRQQRLKAGVPRLRGSRGQGCVEGVGRRALTTHSDVRMQAVAAGKCTSGSSGSQAQQPRAAAPAPAWRRPRRGPAARAWRGGAAARRCPPGSGRSGTPAPGRMRRRCTEQGGGRGGAESWCAQHGRAGATAAPLAAAGAAHTPHSPAAPPAAPPEGGHEAQEGVVAGLRREGVQYQAATGRNEGRSAAAGRVSRSHSGLPKAAPGFVAEPTAGRRHPRGRRHSAQL